MWAALLWACIMQLLWQSPWTSDLHRPRCAPLIPCLALCVHVRSRASRNSPLTASQHMGACCGALMKMPRSVNGCNGSEKARC